MVNTQCGDAFALDIASEEELEGDFEVLLYTSPL